MKEYRRFVLKNLAGHPVRSICMFLLSALMAGALLAGMILVPSLQRGFRRTRQRLGADIMVVPYAALSKKNYDNAFLLGSSCPAYMPGENADEISQIEGVGQVSTQFCLTDTESDLCAESVHLMGYDPGTDFCVTPWIASGAAGAKSNAADPAGADADTPGAVVGSGINAEAGDTISFFSFPLTVTGKMEPTGTDFDASVFVDMDTIRSLARASGDDVLMQRAEADSGNAVSAILVNAAEGYDPEPILNSINIHIKKVRAIQSKDMISSEASSMKGTSLAVGILTAMICAASLAAQCAVSLLMTGERRRESALLRMMGAPQKKLLRIYLAEGAVLSIAGSLCGILLTTAFSGLAAGLFESGPGRAVIFPGLWQVLTCSVLSLILSAAAGLAGTWIMAGRLGAQDAALSLREM